MVTSRNNTAPTATRLDHMAISVRAYVPVPVDPDDTLKGRKGLR
jgi:hypothetical protein